jgi:hypothetical protein
MSMSVSLDCPFLIVTSLTSFYCACQNRTIRNGQSRDTDIDIHKEKDVGDMTIRNGQSRDTNIDMHNKKTLEMGQSGMDNLQTLVYVNVSVSGVRIPDCSISNVFFLCMSMSVFVDSQGMIVLSLRSWNNTLEMGQSGMDNLVTLTLTNTTKRR